MFVPGLLPLDKNAALPRCRTLRRVETLNRLSAAFLRRKASSELPPPRFFAGLFFALVATSFIHLFQINFFTTSVSGCSAFNLCSLLRRITRPANILGRKSCLFVLGNALELATRHLVHTPHTTSPTHCRLFLFLCRRLGGLLFLHHHFFHRMTWHGNLLFADLTHRRSMRFLKCLASTH